MGNDICRDQPQQSKNMYRGTSNASYGAHYQRGYSVNHKVPSLVNHKPVGLENLTNTCYISTVLQILFLIVPENLLRNKGKVTQLFFKLKDGKNTRDYKIFKVAVEKHIEMVQGFEQQDAQEFLIGLLELLNQENSEGLASGSVTSLDYNQSLGIEDNYKNFIRQMKKIENSQIINLFSAELIRQFECMKGHIKHKFERYQCLSLSFPPQKKPATYSYIAQNAEISIEDLIKKELGSQEISGLKCEKCKKNTEFKKLTFLYSLPKYLILHLARFKQGHYSNEKINTVVEYDEYLNLQAEGLKSKVKYRLLGTVNHFGTLNRGHYFAELRYKENNWYEVNDEEVRSTRIDDRGNRSKYVYILFYERISS